MKHAEIVDVLGLWWCRSKYSTSMVTKMVIIQKMSV